MGYSLQCAAVKREKKVLGVNVCLANPDEKSVKKGDANALEDVGYSRFVMTLVDKTGKDTVYPFANIPAADISYIKSIKDIALQNKVLQSCNQNGTSDDGFTSTFPFGNNKGKTVLEVAKSSANPETDLKKQKSFLLVNAERFEINKILIADIDKVLKQIEDGTFNPDASAPVSSSIITIYEQNYKPLKSRVDKEGRVLVYSILMTCNLKMRYAWEITIKNGYAPLKETATGSYEVKSSEMVNQSQSSMKMTDPEFCGMIDTMFFKYRDFSNNTFSDQYKLAKELEWESKSKAIA